MSVKLPDRDIMNEKIENKIKLKERERELATGRRWFSDTAPECLALKLYYIYIIRIYLLLCRKVCK